MPGHAVRGMGATSAVATGTGASARDGSDGRVRGARVRDLSMIAQLATNVEGGAGLYAFRDDLQRRVEVLVHRVERDPLRFPAGVALVRRQPPPRRALGRGRVWELGDPGLTGMSPRTRIPRGR